MDCIFCKIAKGEIKSELVFESPNVIAFNDLHPIAPVHVLIIPKKHYETLNHIPDSDKETMQDIFKAIIKIARDKGIDKSGYRVIANVNKDGGQEIFHAHIHLIGGRLMGKMG